MIMGTPKYLDRISVEVSSETKEWFQNRAKYLSRGWGRTSISDLAREALQAYIEEFTDSQANKGK